VSETQKQETYRRVHIRPGFIEGHGSEPAQSTAVCQRQACLYHHHQHHHLQSSMRDLVKICEHRYLDIERNSPPPPPAELPVPMLICLLPCGPACLSLLLCMLARPSVLLSPLPACLSLLLCMLATPSVLLSPLPACLSLLLCMLATPSVLLSLD
jgi:hypothetical protein